MDGGRVSRPTERRRPPAPAAAAAAAMTAGNRGANPPAYVQLAMELGECMTFEPKRWRNVLEKSSQTLATAGLQAGHKRRRSAIGQGQALGRNSRPGSRDEDIDVSRRRATEHLPPVSVQQYLHQPALVDAILLEHHHEVSNGNQTVQESSTGRAVDAVVQRADDDVPIVPKARTAAVSATRLPLLSTLSPRSRLNIARLPSPTREELREVDELELMAEEECGVDQLYRTLRRQNRQSQQGQVQANGLGMVSKRSPPLRVDTFTKQRSIAPAQKTRLTELRTRVVNAKSTQKCSNKATGARDAHSVEPAAAEHGGGEADCIDLHQPVSSSSQECVPSAPLTCDVEAKFDSSPVKMKEYKQLKAAHRDALNHEQVVGHQVQETIAQVRHWLPLDVIYAFGQGKFASPEQQRASEVLFRAGQRLQYSLLSHAMEKWRCWLWQVIEEERETSSVCLQCWWRGICAVRELMARRKLRRELQRRQLELVRLLGVKQQQAALRITRFFRQCAAILWLQRSEREEAAASAIQRFWKTSCESWLATRRRLRQVERVQAATCIQSLARGVFARRKRLLLTKILRVEHQRQRTSNVQEKRVAALNSLGAAITIQNAYREWNLRRILVLKRRRAAFEKDKRAITKVQAYYRGKRARRQVLSHRKAVASAVLVLQCWWRCVAAVRARQHKIDVRQLKRQRIREQVRDKKKTTLNTLIGFKPKWGKVGAAPNQNRADKVYTDREVKAIAKLQAFCRGQITRRRLRYQKAREAELGRRARRRQENEAAVCIQMRVRGIQGRSVAWLRLENVSARRIQSAWRGVKARMDLQQTRKAVNAIAKMQQRWRNRRHQETLRLRSRSARKIQGVARKYLGKRWLYSMVRRRQYLSEELEMGKRLMESTKARVKDELLLQSFVHNSVKISETRGVRREGEQVFDEGEGKKKAENVTRVDRPLFKVDILKRSWKRLGYDGVWQEVYRNASGNNAEIDNSHFARFLKTLPHNFIHKTQFPVQKADLCFAKMKEPKAKTLSFPRFNRAILMILREKFQPPGTGSQSTDPRGTTDQATSSENDHSNFLRFMNRFVLSSTVQDGKYRKMLDKACMRRVLWAVAVLRRFAVLLERRKQHSHFLVVFKQRQAIKHKNQNATRIQNGYRRYKFRVQLKRMLGAMFIEFIDYQGKAVKFTHSGTGKSVTKRPGFLKGVACGKNIPLPFPGEEFRAFCERHEDSTSSVRAPAQVYCVECEDVMCRVCFARDHSKRSAFQQHPVQEIQICVHCKVETATRVCLQCGDGKVPYCDCCFPVAHKQMDTTLAKSSAQSAEMPTRSSLEQTGNERNLSSSSATQTHRYQALVVMCVECSNRVAQWKCDVCGDVYCKRCLIDFHAKGQRQYHEFHRLSYYSVLRQQAEQKRDVDAEKERERRRKQLEEERRQREAEMVKRNKSATVIEAAVRSFLVRKSGKAYMKLVRQTHVARAQRKKDDKIRGTVLYKMRSVFGVAPPLKSDTAREVASRQRRLAAIKRVLLLQQFLATNQSGNDGDDSNAPKRWTKWDKERAEQAARTWCEYDAQVRVRKGEWKNQMATIVSAKNLLLSGRVLVFIPLANRSVVLDWEWFEPYDGDERLRVPYEPPHKLLLNLSDDFQAKLSRVIDRTANTARLLYMQTIEFADIKPYAWVVEFNKQELREEYWNVVLNKRTFAVPKALQNIERMQSWERERLDARVALAKTRLEALLHPFLPRNKPKLAQRRNAIVHVRAGKGEEIDATPQMAALFESMRAIESVRFWHDSILCNEHLSSSCRSAVSFAASCTKPPHTTRMCWLFVQLLQWLELHDDEGFEPRARAFFDLSNKLQMFVATECTRPIDDAATADFKEAQATLLQLLQLKEDALQVLFSKYQEANDIAALQ